jgi:hypothetical protein
MGFVNIKEDSIAGVFFGLKHVVASRVFFPTIAKYPVRKQSPLKESDFCLQGDGFGISLLRISTLATT